MESDPRAEPLDVGVDVVGHDVDVGAADILEASGSGLRAGPLVLEELEVVAVAGEVCEPYVRSFHARDLLDVVALDLAVRDELESEVAVEGKRALQVGDRQREVMYPRDHSELRVAYRVW